MSNAPTTEGIAAMLIFQVRYADGNQTEQFVAVSSVDAVRQAQAKRPGVEVVSCGFIGKAPTA